MTDYIRDAPLGQLIRFLSRNRYLFYPDEVTDFVYPEHEDPSPTTGNNPQLQFRDDGDVGALQRDVEKQRSVVASSPDSSVKDLVNYLRRALAEMETTIDTHSAASLPQSYNNEAETTVDMPIETSSPRLPNNDLVYHLRRALEEAETASKTSNTAPSPHSSNDALLHHLRRALEEAEMTVKMSVPSPEKIVLVNWYHANDPENPMNWPSGKKAWVTFLIW